MRTACAKVNLWLNVVGRRADGYHLLDSLVAFVDLADTVDAQRSDRLSLEVTGPGSAALAGEADNLVLKAARLLAERAGVPPLAALSLVKRIPVAAGLGGGSADAAAALHVLAELWRLALPEDTLLEVAGALGADVPMCLAGRTALATGIGDRLQPAPALPPLAILLVNPGVALPTRDVFAARRGPFAPARPMQPAWRDVPDLVAVLAERGNDLTEAAISLQPVVAEVLAFLRRGEGTRYVAMSGSGATCYALYDTVAAARRAAAAVPDTWWRHAGGFVSPPA
ncbi:4-(cytidine 5'-diphospho)-2-C-methyl-D-erythritol kinase [Reyranella sp.]|uniref:4-(cytidine 5'-diphospho)-2-C-methyl-D-erythritol kinase n=1 Tax=Reyranella sp. TaxID=1929291 RepID=UPI00378447D4